MMSIGMVPPSPRHYLNAIAFLFLHSAITHMVIVFSFIYNVPELLKHLRPIHWFFISMCFDIVVSTKEGTFIALLKALDRSPICCNMYYT